MFGVAAFEGLFGEELFDRWGNLVDVSCYADTSSSIYGLREDGAVYAATSTVSYSENERKVLEESNDIVAISAGKCAISFLRKDGTVLTSTHYYPEAGQETSGWEKIVTVADNGYVRIGVRTNGTVAVGGEKY